MCIIHEIRLGPSHHLTTCADGWTCMHYACRYRRPDCVKILLASKHGVALVSAKGARVARVLRPYTLPSRFAISPNANKRKQTQTNANKRQQFLKHERGTGSNAVTRMFRGGGDGLCDPRRYLQKGPLIISVDPLA